MDENTLGEWSDGNDDWIWDVDESDLWEWSDPEADDIIRNVQEGEEWNDPEADGYYTECSNRSRGETQKRWGCRTRTRFLRDRDHKKIQF